MERFRSLWWWIPLYFHANLRTELWMTRRRSPGNTKISPRGPKIAKINKMQSKSLVNPYRMASPEVCRLPDINGFSWIFEIFDSLRTSVGNQSFHHSEDLPTVLSALEKAMERFCSLWGWIPLYFHAHLRIGLWMARRRCPGNTKNITPRTKNSQKSMKYKANP